MRTKHAIVAALVLSVVLLLVITATALAYNITPADGGAALNYDIAPHDGFNSGGGTDFCIQCHDIHEAQGDYVLTRKATVTAVCATCHGLFGAQANPDTAPDWSPNQPSTMAGTPPTTSDLIAYNEDMSTMSAAQMDAVPGHSLGVMYGGTIVRADASIPGSTQTLKVITSPLGGIGLFNGQSVRSFSGTQGLYCVSCHSPHGDPVNGGVGRVISGGSADGKMLSSDPNHRMMADGITPYSVNDEPSFCLACHDKRNGPDSNQTTTQTGPDGTTQVVGADDNGNPLHNHPSQFCLTCHGDEKGGVGTQDFPHTSTHNRILTEEPDALCLECHTAGNLP